MCNCFVQDSPLRSHLCMTQGHRFSRIGMHIPPSVSWGYRWNEKYQVRGGRPFDMPGDTENKTDRELGSKISKGRQAIRFMICCPLRCLVLGGRYRGCMLVAVRPSPVMRKFQHVPFGICALGPCELYTHFLWLVADSCFRILLLVFSSAS